MKTPMALLLIPVACVGCVQSPGVQNLKQEPLDMSPGMIIKGRTVTVDGEVFTPPASPDIGLFKGNCYQYWPDSNEIQQTAPNNGACIPG